MSMEDYPIGINFERRQLNKLEDSTTRLPLTWLTIDGTIIQIADMKNSHLRNTIEMLRRTALRKLAKIAARFPSADDRLQIIPEMAFMFPDERALAAWGEVYHELIQEALFRSNGDLNEWMAL